MKTSTSIQLAAAGLLSLASVAVAVPYCAITCFQDVITEHPPLDCTEANMYLCFCKMPSLQNYFLECVYSDCGSTADSEEAVQFGVDTCAGLGVTITVPSGPPTSPTSSAPVVEPTTTAPVEPTTTAPPAEETTSAPVEQSTSAAAPETSEPAAAESTASSTLSTSTSVESGVASPTGSTTTGSATPSSTLVVVNKGNAMNAASGLLGAAGVAAAVFQLL